MISTKIIKKDNDLSYPCLKVHKTYDGLIVLFRNPAGGTCMVSGNTGNSPGKYYNDWAENDFIPFHGQLILENN